MHKLTKIVATIGPATESEEIMRQIILAGVNVARFNTKHNTPEWHQDNIKKILNVARELERPLGILLDLQGPEVRINIPGGKEFAVKEGDEVIFTSNQDDHDPKHIQVPQLAIESLNEGDTVLIDDGIGEFVITSKQPDLLTTHALNSCPIGNRKTLNTPGVIMDLPSLIDQDYAQLDAATNETVDYVGLSFVRNARDVEILRRELENRNLNAAILAKIENQSALDNLDEIIDASDAIMVARGDLAVEVAYQKLAYWQKQIILKSRQKAKPVITATQMLKSMVNNPRPTRAEVLDIANAVYDGTDAVMLSEETTVGKFPVEAVTAQATIAQFNEEYAQPAEFDVAHENHTSYVTHSAVALLRDSRKDKGLHIDKIVCLTETGETARMLARFRPNVPIAVFTSNKNTFRKLCLVHGVTPYVVDLTGDRLESSEELLERIRSQHIANSGETILLVHGTYWKRPGLTNTMSILQI